MQISIIIPFRRVARVRDFDSQTTDQITQRLHSFYEMVIPSAPNWKLCRETHPGNPVGTDYFALKRSDYLCVGGYDECYKGSSLAHLDFTCRWLNEVGRPSRGICEVYHRWRGLEVNASDALNEMRAQHRVTERANAGFPPLGKITYSK